MTGGVRRTARLDLDALRANAVEAVGRHAGRVRLDLRADAYGLGAERVAAALSGIDFAGHDDGDAPFAAERIYGADPDTRPVVTLVGEVVQLKRVAAGQAVSYGYTYRTTGPSTLALVGLGYADGVVRRASNAAPVLLGGRRGAVSGRVAMDQFVVDLRDGDAQVGDEVVLFGDPARGEPSLLEWSEATGWPALALLAGLGPRIHREVVA